jgi:ABC-type antimicrobial peptide transport system permease subunit
MPLLYTIKRIFRTWKLFLALLIGIMLAATFFAGIILKADATAKQGMDQQLSGIDVDMEFSAQLNMSNLAQAQSNVSSIAGVTDLELISRSFQPTLLSGDNFTVTEYIQITGVPSNSRVYEGWLNKPSEGLGENETYVLENTALAKKIKINDTIQTAIQFSTPKLGNTTTVYLNLTVKGFANLDDEAYSIASGNRYYISPLIPAGPREVYAYKSDLLLLSWENTIQKIWSTIPDTAFDTIFLVSVNRDSLISPWDSQTSANNLRTVADNIQNTILANFEHHVNVQDNLEPALQFYQYTFPGLLVTFIIISLPVFFVAWYIGSTVSDVSFNLRRREIGLLSTKGLSSGQIQRMFFSEALLIGLFGGLIGVIGGLLLNQIFTGFNLETLFNPQVLNPYTIVFTVAFGMILSFLSVFFSARRASKLPTVDALREYMPVEADKPYRKRLPWLAFILGTYKIVVFILGINLPQLLSRTSFGGGNFILTLLLVPFVVLDQGLNYVGSLFFFWGLTKLLIQNSLKFQQLTVRTSRFMGDLGALAAKNVRRNPARSAAIAFLIALIIGYGVQVTGQLASEQDYAIRQVRYRIGANVAVSVINATEAQSILDNIVANVSDIQNVTMECTLTQQFAGTQIKTIDPDFWLTTAYYESEWFGGASLEEAFNQLRTDNMTIILERRVAKSLDLKIGDEIGIDFPSGPRKLRIVAFYGPEPTESGIMAQYTLQTWSYVPRNLFNMSSPYSDAYLAESFEVKILMKLNAGANGTRVAESIRNLGLEIYGVDSFDEQWVASQANPSVSNNLQLLDVQRLGIVFAVLAASVGIVLVSAISLKERSREATLMSVRGLSYKQLVWMFLAENLAVVTFAIVLGLGVGFIIVYGNVTSANGVISELVKRRFVFPQDSIVTVVSCVSLIYASTILPIIVMSRQYVTKLERMIRLR